MPDCPCHSIIGNNDFSQAVVSIFLVSDNGEVSNSVEFTYGKICDTDLESFTCHKLYQH